MLLENRRSVQLAMIRILIAEDSQLMRELLAHHLRSVVGFDLVGCAQNGREIVDMAALHRPDIILMDLDMPLLNGLQATEQILSRQSYIHVILLTSHTDLASIGRLAGTSECLNKNCSMGEITETIRRVHGTQKSKVQSVGASFAQQNQIDRLAMRAALSDREKLTLKSLMDTDLTIAQIATRLSAEVGAPVSVSAVKHAIERITNKFRMETKTRAALIKYVLESGSSSVQDEQLAQVS